MGGLTCREPHAGRQRILNGMLSILIDPRRLGTAEHLAREAEAYLDWLRRSPPAAPGGIALPGEPERRARHHAERHGVLLDSASWRQIEAAAGKLGLPADELQRLAGL